MSDFRSCSMTSAEHQVFRGGAMRKVSPSSVAAGNGSWDASGAMDQITVVRIDDSHIVEERTHVDRKVKNKAADCYKVEYSTPASEEEEEEEDSVFIIEYSNPEEEGESYQFTMSLDRSHPVKKPFIKHPGVADSPRDPPRVTPRPGTTARQNRRLEAEEEMASNKSLLELGEDYKDVMGSEKCQLKCSMCPPPGRFFKRASGLAIHLKLLHQMEEKKTFFCTYCNQTLRNQTQLDAHTRRHAKHDAMFTCHLCLANGPESTGFKGSRYRLKRHLEEEHPGVIPRCHICNKGFRTLNSYLADQFRHVGVSPYYCAKCQIYEMTERGLSVHIRNHNKKPKQESEENHPQTPGVSSSVENSATDDSDF